MLPSAWRTEPGRTGGAWACVAGKEGTPGGEESVSQGTVGNHSRVCKGRWSVIHENVDTDRAPGTSISTCLAPSGSGWPGCACGVRILPMPQALSQPCPPESGGSWRGAQSGESLHGPALTCTPGHSGEAFSTRPSCFPGCPGGSLPREAPYLKSLLPQGSTSNCVLEETRPPASPTAGWVWQYPRRVKVRSRDGMTLGPFPSHWNHFCPLKVNPSFPEKILGLVRIVPCNSNRKPWPRFQNQFPQLFIISTRA